MDSSVLFVRQEKKSAADRQEQVFFSHSRREDEALKATQRAEKLQRIRRANSDLDRDRVVWLKEKGLIAKGRGQFRTQVLTAEERVVHRALVSLVPESVQLSGVHIATNSSKVHAQLTADESIDQRELFRLRQDFERQTGRQLVFDRPSLEPAGKEPAAKPAARAGVVVSAGSKSASKPLPASTPEPPREEKSRSAPSDDSRGPAPAPSEKPFRPKLRHISYAVAGVEAAGAAAAAAAHGATILALNPQVVIDPKIGLIEGIHRIENRWSSTSESGGSSRNRFFQPPPEETDDEGDPRNQQQSEENQKTSGATTESKGKGRAQAQQPSDRLIHAERLALEETSDHSGREGKREGRSACRCCGTELPESQRDACPICAQSGPDVIATAAVHYRFAGSKFLAAADSVSASSLARGVLEQGVESVVSLRYKPKIPGHKDFLRFRAT